MIYKGEQQNYKLRIQYTIIRKNEKKYYLLQNIVKS